MKLSDIRFFAYYLMRFFQAIVGRTPRRLLRGKVGEVLKSRWGVLESRESRGSPGEVLDSHGKSWVGMGSHG